MLGLRAEFNLENCWVPLYMVFVSDLIAAEVLISGAEADNRSFLCVSGTRRKQQF
jgi:hypothetical protein